MLNNYKKERKTECYTKNFMSKNHMNIARKGPNGGRGRHLEGPQKVFR